MKVMEKFKEQCQAIFDELKEDGFSFSNEHKSINFSNKINFIKNGITAKVNEDIINGKDIWWFEPDVYYSFVKNLILKTYEHQKELINYGKK